MSRGIQKYLRWVEQSQWQWQCNNKVAARLYIHWWWYSSDLLNLFLQDEDVSHEMDIFIVKIGYNYIKIYMPFLKTSPSFCRSLWVSGHSKAHLENVITFGQGSVCRHVRIGIRRIVLEYRVGIITVVISLTEI